MKLYFLPFFCDVMQWHVVVFINSTSYLRDQYLYVALNCCFNIVHLQINSQQAVLFPHRHPVLVPLCHDVHHHPACTWHAYDMCSEGEKHAEHQSGASAVVAQPCTLMHPQGVILHNHASEAAIKRKEKAILTFYCLRTPTVLRCISLFDQKRAPGSCLLGYVVQKNQKSDRAVVDFEIFWAVHEKTFK